MVDIFNQLGINQTVFIQFIIYIFIFTFLSLYVFQPYVQALEKREEKTKGTEVIAEEIRGRYNDVNMEYQNKAKEIHGNIQEIYGAIKKEATIEYDRIVNEAKKRAQGLMDENNAAITKAMASASADLRKDSQNLTTDIVRKVLGK